VEALFAPAAVKNDIYRSRTRSLGFKYTKHVSRLHTHFNVVRVTNRICLTAAKVLVFLSTNSAGASVNDPPPTPNYSNRPTIFWRPF